MREWLVRARAAGGYTSQVVSDGGANLLGYWPLDAVDGLTDKSTGGHNATAVGSPTVGGAAGPGHLTATALDGSTQYFTVTYNPFTNATVRTYEIWVKKTGATARIAIGASTNGNGPFIQNTNATTLAWYADGGVDPGVSWAGFSTGAWRHIMIVFDESGNTVKLYLDGSLVSSQADTTPYNGTPGNLRIGAYLNGSSPWDGSLAHVAIYNGDQSAFALSHYTLGSS